MAARKTSTGKAAANAVDAQLARYRSMRDFKVTAEPAGGGRGKAGAGLPFVIQKHAASHLHYDFRLGWKGVLKSWACAKGPSYGVGDKRLAVEVEDHPMEYGGFEGIIPAGQYGGGTVMVWDEGTWEPQAGHEDVDAGLRDGQLKFVMHGTKMDGRWALIRMHERVGGRYGRTAKPSKPNWLLIKEHDEFERAADAPAVTEAEPKSAVTGRTLEEIAANEDHVWNSKETAKGPQAWFRQDLPKAAGKKAAGKQAAGKPGAGKKAAVRAAALDLDGLPEELQPGFLKPQLAAETEAPPAAAGWLHELKLDGYRMQARKQGAKVQMLTRSGLDWTDRVEAVAAEVARLPFEALTLDGEVVVLQANGTTNFADLQAAFQQGALNPLTYFVFDLLHVEGRSPRELPLVARKALLEKIVAGAEGGVVQFSEHLVADGEEMFHKACELHAEGIVSKKAQGKYAGSRNGDWLKSKCLHEQEFVVVGYTLPQKSRTGGPGLGSLLLGYYDDAGQTLVYAGRTGTGFNQKFAAVLRRQLEGMEQAASALKKVTGEARKDAIWVKPEVVAQVRFATWTADDQLRQAAFLGIREDKPAKEVRRETAAPTPKSNARKASGALKPAEVKAAKPGKPLAMERAPVRLTHPEKVLDPESKLTKQQLADFYWAVAPRMLPHIAGRALSLVRLPNGIGKESFYQKNVTSTLPAGFDSVPVPDGKTGEIHQYVAISTPEGVAALAQMSVLEVHPWGSMAADLERPDRLVIDLDPDEALGWSVLTGAAAAVRKELKALGLESFLKTTGGKGLHVVVPVAPKLAYPEAKRWCHGLVQRMERANPKLYLTVMSKAARKGKIYLDYLRNERGATAVAPYSPRARANVGVAVPLEWKELGLAERPDFRIGNFAEWSGRLRKDPWAKMHAMPQEISAAARKVCGVK